MKQKLWFLAGMMGALTIGAFANIPRKGSPSGSIAVTPDVSEIKTQRHSELSFDEDLKRLEASQGRYREHLPLRPTHQRVAAKGPVAKKPAPALKSSHAKAKPVTANRKKI